MGRRKRRRAYNSGTIYKRGTRWRIEWRENGRRRFKAFGDEELARRALAKITGDIEALGVGLPVETPPPPPLAHLAKPWLERRERTHRASRADACRWRVHLEPFFGRMRPDEVDGAVLRSFIERKLSENRGTDEKPRKLATATVQRCVRLLSALFSDLCEQGIVKINPVRVLPRSTRRLIRSVGDGSATPFLERLDDVRRVFLVLPEPTRVAFALGAFGGLRTGEILGLDWRHIDLAGRRLHVRQQLQDGELRAPKDADPRTVPIPSQLSAVLTEYKLKTGGIGLVFQPRYALRGGRPELGVMPTFMRETTLRAHLRKALLTCELPSMSWYEATRHTFASQYVMSGGSMEKLAKILGHSSVAVTERHYCHLRVDLFTEQDVERFAVVLAAPTNAPAPHATKSAANPASDAAPRAFDADLPLHAKQVSAQDNDRPSLPILSTSDSTQIGVSLASATSGPGGGATIAT